MDYMFVNLKRFDIPVSRGGLCPNTDAAEWVSEVINESKALGLGDESRVKIVYILPESLLIPARQAIARIGKDKLPAIDIGCQGVYRKDVEKGGNFGAFTTFLPATAAQSIGCSWAMVGHSEERQDYFELFSLYGRSITDKISDESANALTHSIMNEEALKAFGAGLNVLFCLGETQEERGDGPFEAQKERLQTVLREQVRIGLKGFSQFTGKRELVLGYEPRWAIGPGKTPPGPEYISYVTQIIKDAAEDLYGLNVDIVYGGGLKRENAKDISQVESVSGGLVALTKFTAPIGFSPSEFSAIIEEYCEA